jgi:hypothetical protein
MGARALPDLPVHFFGEPKKGPLFAAQKAGRQADGLPFKGLKKHS